MTRKQWISVIVIGLGLVAVSALTGGLFNYVTQIVVTIPMMWAYAALISRFYYRTTVEIGRRAANRDIAIQLTHALNLAHSYVRGVTKKDRDAAKFRMLDFALSTWLKHLNRSTHVPAVKEWGDDGVKQYRIMHTLKEGGGYDGEGNPQVYLGWEDVLDSEVTEHLIDQQMEKVRETHDSADVWLEVRDVGAWERTTPEEAVKGDGF